MSKTRLPALWVACAIAGTNPGAQAAPVELLNATDLLSRADTVVVAKVASNAPGAHAGDRVVTLDVRRVLESHRALGPKASVSLTDSKPVASNMNTGNWGLFILNCKSADEPCSPVSTAWPALPAVEVAPSTPATADLPRSVIAELVAVVAAADTTLAASSDRSPLSADQAAHVRSAAVDALAGLPQADVRDALAAVGRPAYLPARLAITSAQIQARDFSALADVTSALISDDDGLRAARRDVAWALDGVQQPPAAIVATMSAWLRAPDDVVREAAAHALRSIATPDVIRPLLESGITDTSPKVRYYAVTGLAAATHEGEYPSMQRFHASEGQYIAYWQARKAKLASAP